MRARVHVYAGVCVPVYVCQHHPTWCTVNGAIMLGGSRTPSLLQIQQGILGMPSLLLILQSQFAVSTSHSLC